MEPANLIAYRLRKLASEHGDAERMADTIRLLLEVDRSMHTAPTLQRQEPLLSLVRDEV